MPQQDGDTDTGSDGDADGDADSDADGDADSDADGDADSDADGDADSDADGDADSDADGDADADADADADGDADSDADNDADSDADGDADSDADNDADADTDTDADSDTDTDTDADTDSDSDGDADQFACSPEPDIDYLNGEANTVDDAVWMERCQNTSHVQGAFYKVKESKTGGSTIEADWSGSTEGEFCASGTLVEIVDWSDGYWGAGLGFDICQTAGHEDPSDKKFTLSTCPWNLGDISGVKMSISGTISAGNEMRVQFVEKGRTENTYIVADTGANQSFDFSDAAVQYDSSAPDLEVDDIESISVQFSAAEGQEGSFDICISDISLY